MIKFSHTVFALPVAFVSMLVAAGYRLPALRSLLLILAAMITARTAAMTFNRIADIEFDKLNPRTKDRHLPAGLLTKRFAALFTLLSSLLFLITCYFINRLALALSPVALGLVLLYSYTKRFTSLSHFLLGFCLAIAPAGAWIAITGELNWPPCVLAAAVIFWVAGFDIIYSILDYRFDREHGLHSIAARLGIGKGLIISRLCHLTSVACLVWFGLETGLGTLYFTGNGVVALLLAYEHLLAARPDIDEKGLNKAFFHANSLVSVALLAFTSLDIFL